MIALPMIAAVLLSAGNGIGGMMALADSSARSFGSWLPVPNSQVVSQSPVASPQSPAPGSELTIYLLTMGDGDQIWERFGHNAIRVVDASRGTDSVYHWGAFDFAQPNFLQRFLTGNTLYWMKGETIAETMAQYHYLNRSVWSQELDLRPSERVALRDRIAWNAKEENLYYRYDYYLDNCSTRIRDLIDLIVGGQLKIATVGRLTSATYRGHTQRAFQWDRAVALGTNIGLGEKADRPLNQWEESFLPGRLQEHLRSVQVRSADGTMRPLVKPDQQLFAANRPALPAEAPNTLPRNLLIGVVIAALLGVLARAAASGSHGSRIGFASLATIWVAINGIVGVILVVGWTATRHVFMVNNENLLQFDPLSLGLAVVLPMAVLRTRAAGLARRLASAIAVIAVVGVAMKLVPIFHQANLAVIALTLPAHLVVAWAVRALTFRPAPRPSPRGVAAAAVSRSAA